MKCHGLAITPPPAWDVRVYQRRPAEGERTFPILHAANFPLPAHRGDFGSGAVELMGAGHVFISLFEHESAAARTALFNNDGLPRPTPAAFSPRALQRTLRGQSGVQYFFREKGRAFCLYIVLGSHARRRQLVSVVNQALDSLSVT